VIVPVGETSAEFYYKDPTAGNPVLTASAAGLTAGTLEVEIRQRTNAPPGEVAIYTGAANWITKDLADAQAQICAARLEAAGIPFYWISDAAEETELADWMFSVTNNGELDVLILYGYFPSSIYLAGNLEPNDSIAEAFIESEDGDAIINHADWMFYVSSTINGAAGLQNMMDITGIEMGPDNTPMVVTAEGKEIAPNLPDFLSDRPLHLDQLAGDWLVEAVLARNEDGTRADPVIVRDGDRGRLIPMFQAASQNDPKGAVAAEVIAWLMDADLPPDWLVLSGSPRTVANTPVKITITLAGTSTPLAQAIKIDLESDSGTGTFDTVFDGPYDGSVTSVTLPAGDLSATFHYLDTSAGRVTLSATAPAVKDLTAGGGMRLDVLEDLGGSPGQVAIYTGTTGWISEALADQQAQICVEMLNDFGISNLWYPDATDQTALSEWVDLATGNGKVDVLVLYGSFPTTLYPEANTMPDGSIAEAFIESTDGDVIINHADYMFYVNGVANNEAGGLQNMMDITGITMWDDDTPMVVTDEGMAISMNLVDFLSDRPFHLDQLAGEWFVEVALAQNAAGTRADPVIVRDGNRGRLIPVFQAGSQNDPKGAVAADIIAWIMARAGGDDEPRFIRGDTDGNGVYTIGDGIQILERLFTGREALSSGCEKTGDTDDNGVFTVGDAITLFNFLFVPGSAPPKPPTPACGVDPTPDAISCEQDVTACR
ncbi:MAG: hypothetical protein JXP34_21275, partial [Planctomycetes bacterium]|nr:hypothetical protein [Planctomycetota bacterium]